MKKILILFILFVLGNQIVAQTESKNIPISVGFMSHIWHPGVKIGTQFDLKNWERETEKQIGFYVYPNTHTGYLVNTDFGYKKIKSHKQKYSAFSIGLGFLNQSQITDVKINLSDGSKEKIRENWGWFLSTLNYEIGKSINEKIGWYGKLSYGLKMSLERENSTVLFIELGMKYNFNKLTL